jgi:hypothetical protein
LVARNRSSGARDASQRAVKQLQAVTRAAARGSWRGTRRRLRRCARGNKRG